MAGLPLALDAADMCAVYRMLTVGVRPFLGARRQRLRAPRPCQQVRLRPLPPDGAIISPQPERDRLRDDLELAADEP